jgi:hypothetical protein
MLAVGMEGMNTKHATGYTYLLCGGVAVVDIDGDYLCAAHAIEAMTTVEIDLREKEPAVSASTR